MDDSARRAEYDANVAAFKDALAHCSRDELLHIAATQIVNGLYIESAHQQEATALRAAIAVNEESRQHLASVHQAERDQWVRQTVQHLIGLVPEMGRRVRKESSQKATDARYDDDPKQMAKAAIEAEWLCRRKVQGKARWFAAFSREMVEKYPVIENPDTIEKKWIPVWEKSYAKNSQES
jgi:hypothetical protein